MCYEGSLLRSSQERGALRRRLQFHVAPVPLGDVENCLIHAQMIRRESDVLNGSSNGLPGRSQVCRQRRVSFAPRGPYTWRDAAWRVAGPEGSGRWPNTQG